MIGQCSLSDEDQLHYCEVRTECLQQSPSTIFTDDDIEAKDVLRFLKGDGPAIAFETGHQKEEILPVPHVKLGVIFNFIRIFNFTHSVYSKHLT